MYPPCILQSRPNRQTVKSSFFSPPEHHGPWPLPGPLAPAGGGRPSRTRGPGHGAFQPLLHLQDQPQGPDPPGPAAAGGGAQLQAAEGRGEGAGAGAPGGQPQPGGGLQEVQDTSVEKLLAFYTFSRTTSNKHTIKQGPKQHKPWPIQKY